MNEWWWWDLHLYVHRVTWCGMAWRGVSNSKSKWSFWRDEVVVVVFFAYKIRDWLFRTHSIRAFDFDSIHRSNVYIHQPQENWQKSNNHSYNNNSIRFTIKRYEHFFFIFVSSFIFLLFFLSNFILSENRFFCASHDLYDFIEVINRVLVEVTWIQY